MCVAVLFCFFQAGAQDDPKLAECLRDAHQFLTITQVQQGDALYPPNGFDNENKFFCVLCIFMWCLNNLKN